jgi:hypothetical protein
MRKAAHEGLNKGVVKDFHETQTKEALLLAAGGLAEPAQWDKHLRRAAASMVLSVVYDKPTIKSEQDRGVKLINDFVQRLTRAAYPGAHFVEFFPWMLYIPSRHELQYIDPCRAAPDRTLKPGLQSGSKTPRTRISKTLPCSRIFLTLFILTLYGLQFHCSHHC